MMLMVKSHCMISEVCDSWRKTRGGYEANLLIVDSLKAVDLRNRIFRDVQADLSVFEILSPLPLSKLSMTIVSRSDAVPSEMAKQAVEELSGD